MEQGCVNDAGTLAVASPHTLLQTAIGSNKVRTLTGPSSVDRRDQFRLVLPAGGVLTSILVDGLSPGEGSPGPALTLLSPDAFPLAGITLTPASVGTDVIASFAAAIATSGSLRFDITSFSGRSALQLDFVVTPLPAASGFLAVGFLLLGALRRRR